MRRRVVWGASALAILTMAGLSACSGSGGEADDGTVTITVQGRPADTDEAGQKAFDAWVEEFEKENPGITVEGSTNVWDATTFSAKLAGGNIEDVISVPLTEPQGLISRGQVADITDLLKESDYYEELNPQAVEPLSDADGDVYGVPQSLYAQGLVYNRDLFEQAGLDPDDPPSTWDEVREAAAAITDATGKAGFVIEGTNNQGGWQLTMMTYAFGGEMETGSGDDVEAVTTSDATTDALELVKAMRWDDESMGSNALYDQNTVIQDFAAGNIGMYMGTPGTYSLAKVTYQMADTDAFGLTSMPQDGGGATLTGGQVFMIPSSVEGEELDAAVKWLEYAYLRPAYDPDVAAENAKALSESDNAAIGVPSLPIFDEERQAKIDEAIAPYVNVNLDNFQPYRDGTADLTLTPEPSTGAQALYGVLDTVVQTVLTDENADVGALLEQAEADANQKIAAAK